MSYFNFTEHLQDIKILFIPSQGNTCKYEFTSHSGLWLSFKIKWGLNLQSISLVHVFQITFHFNRQINGH
jgi:hypothetical protein